MKRILSLAILIVILAMAYMPMVIKADDSRLGIGAKIVLKGGYEATVIGYDRDGRPIYQADLSTPTYLDDLTTRIDTQWRIDGDWYMSGKNKFNAAVKDETVSVTDNNSKSMTWSPQVKVGNSSKKTTHTKAAVLPIDPINPNYRNNTLMWDYGNGLKRYLRAIEGMLIEYYTLDSLPDDDVTITNNANKSTGFVSDRRAIAYDSNNKRISLTVDAKHNITVSKKDLAKAKYPITIDPDSTFTTSSSDGYASFSYGFAASVQPAVNAWAAMRTATASGHTYPPFPSSDDTFSSQSYSTIGVVNGNFPFWGGWVGSIERAYVYFDTSALTGFVVSAANLKLYIYERTTGIGAFTVVLQSGMVTYPHDPLVTGDYNQAAYAGSLGTLATGAMTVGAYNTMALNGGGIAAINTSGTTKFALREKEHDIDNVDPASTNTNSIFFYTYEQGVGYRPQLVVTFTATAPGITVQDASNIAKTTARLNATVTDDGGDADVEVRFGYGKISKAAGDFDTYTTVTAWVDGYLQNSNPYVDVSSLDATSTYYFRAQVRNSNSTITSTSEETFDTLTAIGNVSTFYGYPDKTSLSLSWARGAGASRVMIRYRPDTYPNATNDGDQIYLGDASTFEFETLPNGSALSSGKTYYFAAWGESGGSYSAASITLAMTTLSASATIVDYGDSLPSPMLPVSFFQEPDTAGFTSLPFWGIVADAATSAGMPAKNMLLTLGIGMIVIVGGFIALKMGNPVGAIAVMCVLMVILVIMKVIPAYMVLLMILIGGGIFVLNKMRQGAA